MLKLSRLFTPGCLLSMILVATGCGSPDTTSSKATAQVKGKITVGGKPLANVEVTFNPSNINRKDVPAVASRIKEDGRYELTTLVGQNQVTLSGPGVARSPQLAYFSKTFDVQSGTNEFDIVLP